MAAGTVKRSYIGSISTISELSSERLPDTGPLNIIDYERFLKKSREIFNEKWSGPRNSIERTASLVDFKMLQLLGSGSFASVTLVRHKPSENLYAMKCMDKEKIIKNYQLRNVKTEQLLLRCTNHPFVMYSLFSFKDNNYLYFVLPFVEGGDLFGHLKALRKRDEDLARFYISQVILALEYLHYVDFVYRDLKPENVMIDHTGYLKLADFGFTKRLKRQLRTYTLCGTAEYMAPEIILNKGYGKAVDWWATGCLIYELVAGQTPFVARTAVMTFENIVCRRYKMPTYFSPELRELVDKMLQADLSKRYGNLRNGARDIKDHKWLLNTDWLAILNRQVVPPYKPERQVLNLEENNLSWKLPKTRTSKEDKYSEEFADF